MRARPNDEFASIQVISYHDQNISAWSAELKQLDKNIQTLTATLEADEKKLESLLNDKIAHQNLSKKIEHNTQLNKQLTNTAQALLEQAMEAMEFMKKLRHEPGLLVEKNKKKILKLKIDHDKKYPREQSDVVRICLMDIDEKINKIMSEEQDRKEMQENKKKQQMQYFELAGFLWRMLDLFKAVENKLTEKDRELVSQILAILNDMHINKDDDLLPELAIKKTCAELYRTTFKDISLSDMRQKEAQCYNKALADLKNTLSHPQISTAIKTGTEHVITEVEKYMNSDIKFSTQVLIMTHELVRPSGDTILNLQNYLALADDAYGKPSYWRMVAGAMIGLAGLAVIGLSVFGAIASFGGISPVSVLGVQFGVSLVSAAISFSAGFGSYCTGVYLFSSGIRKGLSTKMVDLGAQMQTEPLKSMQRNSVPQMAKSSDGEISRYVPLNDESASPQFIPPPAMSHTSDPMISVPSAPSSALA